MANGVSSPPTLSTFSSHNPLGLYFSSSHIFCTETGDTVPDSVPWKRKIFCLFNLLSVMAVG